MKNEEINRLVIAAIVVSGLIIFVCGFLIGKIMTQKDECIENPFAYGIKKVNKINNEEFSCICTSNKDFMRHFNFDETGYLHRAYP